MKEKRNKSKGFTLAELLIVVTIIAVLVAVSIPIFASRLAKAKETVCKNERATMKHACVIDALSGEVNWNDHKKSTDEETAEDIMNYLSKHNSIDFFKCQSGGKISAIVSEKGDSVTFYCSEHDKLDGGGSGGGSTLTGTETAQKELEEAIAEFAKGYTGDSANQAFLNKFFEKYPNYPFKKCKPSDILKSEWKDKWLAALSIKYPDKESSLKADIEKISDTEYSIVPYKMKDGTVVSYYAKSTDVFTSKGKCHTETNLICYKGEWYASTNLNGLKNQFSPSTVAWLNKDEFNNITKEEFEEQASNLEPKWVKVSSQ